MDQVGENKDNNIQTQPDRSIDEDGSIERDTKGGRKTERYIEVGGIGGTDPYIEPAVERDVVGGEICVCLVFPLFSSFFSEASKRRQGCGKGRTVTGEWRERRKETQMERESEKDFFKSLPLLQLLVQLLLLGLPFFSLSHLLIRLCFIRVCLLFFSLHVLLGLRRRFS